MWKTWHRDVIAEMIDRCLKRNGIEPRISMDATGPIEFCDGDFQVREVSPDMEQIGDASLPAAAHRDVPLLELRGYAGPHDVRYFEIWRDLWKVLNTLR